MVRRVAAALVCISLAGCGARTGLADAAGDAGAADADASAQADAGRDADAALPPVDAKADVPAVQSGCEAALQPGAPTPMPGYCSTRAHLSPFFAPTAPKLAWQQPLPLQTPYEVIELVVDASGRIYATLDTAVSGWVLPDTLVALDQDGTLLWTQPYGDKVPAALFLAGDGLLRMRLSETPPVLAVIASDGTLKDKLTLPDTQRHGFAVGRDGTLYTALWDSTTSTRVARLAADATVLWASESFERCGVATSPVMLGLGDLAVIGISASSAGSDCSSLVTRLLAWDASGNKVWMRDLPGFLVHNPAVGTDGAVRATYVPGAEAQVHLALVDASGDVAWDVELPGTAVNVWGSPVVVTLGGTAIVRTSGSIVAVAPNGELLWTIDNDPMLPYGAFADPGGQLIVTGHSIVSYRHTTGEQYWEVEGLSGPVVMGPDRSVVGTIWQAGGELSIALARNP